MLHKLKHKNMLATVLIQVLLVAVFAFIFVLVTGNFVLGILMALQIGYWDWILEKILYKRSVRHTLAVLAFVGLNYFFYYNNQPTYQVFSTKILLYNAAIIALIVLMFFKPDIWRDKNVKQQEANKELN
jgi:hypothetical protein